MFHIDLLKIVLLSLPYVLSPVLCQRELNPTDSLCNYVPSYTKCDGAEIVGYFYNNTKKACTPFKANDCGDGSGYPDLESCQEECMKKRQVRRLPSESKYEILSDLQMTAPKKLSKATKRKFPIHFCSLAWDSGLICPGLRRGLYLDQFFYDDKTNSCSHFIYNGCGGNANRFDSIWSCYLSCRKKRRVSGTSF